MKKFTASTEQLKPDAVYNSMLVSKFINCLMVDGMKSTAQRVFYDAMDVITKELKNKNGATISASAGTSLPLRKQGQKNRETGSRSKQKTANSPLEVFQTAVNNVKPMVEVRSKRVGGASYQVPMQVNPKRRQSLAFRWILASSRSKKGKPMYQRLASELIDAYNGHGGAMTTRENVHRMAEANKAFAHFAW